MARWLKVILSNRARVIVCIYIAFVVTVSLIVQLTVAGGVSLP